MKGLCHTVGSPFSMPIGTAIAVCRRGTIPKSTSERTRLVLHQKTLYAVRVMDRAATGCHPDPDDRRADRLLRVGLLTASTSRNAALRVG